LCVRRIRAQPLAKETRLGPIVSSSVRWIGTLFFSALISFRILFLVPGLRIRPRVAAYAYPLTWVCTAKHGSLRAGPALAHSDDKTSPVTDPTSSNLGMANRATVGTARIAMRGSVASTGLLSRRGARCGFRAPWPAKSVFRTIVVVVAKKKKNQATTSSLHSWPTLPPWIPSGTCRYVRPPSRRRSRKDAMHTHAVSGLTWASLRSHNQGVHFVKVWPFLRGAVAGRLGVPPYPPPPHPGPPGAAQRITAPQGMRWGGGGGCPFSAVSTASRRRPALRSRPQPDCLPRYMSVRLFTAQPLYLSQSGPARVLLVLPRCFLAPQGSSCGRLTGEPRPLRSYGSAIAKRWLLRGTLFFFPTNSSSYSPFSVVWTTSLRGIYMGGSDATPSGPQTGSTPPDA
jgi:hypothetical protein